ncbi:MAG: polysaccharide deacetylase family protein [Chloroflexi bacterium]|nr:polysaccharide deacetylase family protein [Chloroflexota bacterium]
MPKYACVTLDMEPDYGDPLGRIRLLDTPEFFERFVGLIRKYNARVTMFTVTSLFEAHSQDFERLAARIPLEYAVHSHNHDPHNACGLDEVQAAQKAYQQFTGRAPAGYRAPIGQIDRDGLGHLMDHGYRYDSSVYTSIRPGKFGYFNLHLPNVPFWLTRGGREALLEFPFTSISTVRVVYALSYAKLLGWPLYSALLQLFGLPEVALLLLHPYNFYTKLTADGLAGFEKFALTRNDERSFEYFERMLAALRKRGYEFLLVSEIYERIQDQPNLPRLAWEEWR